MLQCTVEVPFIMCVCEWVCVVCLRVIVCVSECVLYVWESLCVWESMCECMWVIGYVWCFRSYIQVNVMPLSYHHSYEKFLFLNKDQVFIQVSPILETEALTSFTCSCQNGRVQKISLNFLNWWKCFNLEKTVFIDKIKLKIQWDHIEVNSFP